MESESSSALGSLPSSPLSVAPSSSPCSSHNSSPLSVLSKSPSPPSSPLRFDASLRYPSPSTTAPLQSGSASPMKPQNAAPSLSEAPQHAGARDDGPPPAKRRKIQSAAPRLKPRKERMTEYLDLDKTSDDGPQDELLDRLMTVFRTKKRIVIIAGAGISVSAGIPDFRSSTGLFKTLRGQHKLKSSGKDLFHASVYSDNSSTSSFHAMVTELASMSSHVSPTPFHHMMASIAHENRLLRLYTQNIDCLETNMTPLATKVPLKKENNRWPTTIQLHGGLENMYCSTCGNISPFDGERFDGPEPPPCKDCEYQEYLRIQFGGKRGRGVGRLRPRIVLYGETNPDADEIGLVSQSDLSRVPDAVIVVGTTLKVPGARRLVKELCKVTRSRRDGFTAWLNVEPEPQGNYFNDCWDLVVRGKCDDVAGLVNLPRWDQQAEALDPQDPTWKVTVDAEEERKRHACGPVVSISSPPATSPTEAKSRLAGKDESGGIPTPKASPRLGPALPLGVKTGLPSKTQSKLAFGNGRKKLPTGASGTGATKPVAPAKVVKPKKPRKPTAKATKKEIKAGADLTKAFKSTKAGLAVTTKLSIKQEPSPVPSSPVTPTEESAPGLPSLRPSNLKARQPAISTAPTVPQSPDSLSRRSSLDTISPTSKPRHMAHLIH